MYSEQTNIDKNHNININNNPNNNNNHNVDLDNNDTSPNVLNNTIPVWNNNNTSTKRAKMLQ